VPRGALLGAWLLVGAAVWLGFFDLYVSRGAREFLQRQAEFELGRTPQPSLDAVMRKARLTGVAAASGWATLVVAGGLALYWRGTRAGAHASRTAPPAR
jgi:hypothetical protein